MYRRKQPVVNCQPISMISWSKGFIAMMVPQNISLFLNLDLKQVLRVKWEICVNIYISNIVSFFFKYESIIIRKGEEWGCLFV